MFTGIVQEIGTVAAVDHGADGSTLHLRAPATAGAVRVGDSVAIDGVCLTVTSRDDGVLAFDAMHETLQRSTLGALAPGDVANLEAALRAGEPLGGHIVQGHVDGVGDVVEERPEGFARTLRLVLPEHLRRYVVEKGSICLAGVSLTVAGMTADGCEVCLIPHTGEASTLGNLGPGDRVNVEVDILAKYVERLLNFTAVGTT
jgi:riboflavin synthase